MYSCFKSGSIYLRFKTHKKNLKKFKKNTQGFLKCADTLYSSHEWHNNKACTIKGEQSTDAIFPFWYKKK